MTQKKKTPADGRRTSSVRSRRRKAQRRRVLGRMLKLLAIVVLLLGLAALAISFFLDEAVEETVPSYPMAYVDLIRHYAAENGLEPAYVASVIMAESSYRSDAVSSVNAQGLMQIMPSTGEWIAGKFDEGYTEGCLFDPETNIKYGCWYLGFLMDRYDGDMRCSSAAYHSGQGTVDGWLKDDRYSLDGKTLSVIPGSNADTYVNRILEYYAEYEKIYADYAA